MPKIKLKRQPLRSNPYTGSSEVEGSFKASSDNRPVDVAQASGVPALSRGQRRRQERKERVFSKQGKVEPLFLSNHKNKSKQKMRQSDKVNTKLSELELSLHQLGDTTVKPASMSQITSNTMKKTIAVREAARMKLVQEHLSTVENPLEAVRLHLQQMIAMKNK